MGAYSKEKYDATFKKPSPPKSKSRRKLVRCLGPKEKEHYFMSEGPHNRLCFNCQRVVANYLPKHVEAVHLERGKGQYHE